MNKSLLHVDVTDITGKHHEIFCDKWKEDSVDNCYTFCMNGGEVVAIFYIDKTIGVKFVGR